MESFSRAKMGQKFDSLEQARMTFEKENAIWGEEECLKEISC